jgi:O-antigen/teichoic acid export membrane protein
METPRPRQSITHHFRRIVGGLGRAGGRGAWMGADQAVVSLGNFLTANILARHLPERQWGAYGLMLETILFLNGLQAALVNYPLTVRAAGDGRQLRRSTTAALLFSAALLPILAVAMFLSGRGAAGSEGIAAGLAAVVAMGLWQIQETLRRSLVADSRIAASIFGDSIGYLGQAAVLWALARVGMLTLPMALLVIGGSSALAAAVQAGQIGLETIAWADLIALAKDFWRLGRWMLLSNCTAIVTSLGLLWTLRFSGGLEAVAMFTAVTMLLKLANPVFSGISALLIPAVAKAHATVGMHQARREALRWTGLGAAVLLPYYAGLCLFPGLALRMCYGSHSPYLAAGMLLELYVISRVVDYAVMAVGGVLAGLGQTRRDFTAQMVHTLVVLIACIPMTYAWGVRGIILGSIVASGSYVIVASLLLRGAMREAEAVSELPPARKIAA